MSWGGFQSGCALRTDVVGYNQRRACACCAEGLLYLDGPVPFATSLHRSCWTAVLCQVETYECMLKLKPKIGFISVVYV